MTGRFVLSKPAARDLNEILAFVADASGETQALHVAKRLEKALQILAGNPLIAHRRPELTSSPLSFYAVWSYLIVIKPDSDPLEIVRVLHGARDLESLLDVDAM